LQEKNATKKEEDKSYKYSQADIDRLQNVYWAAMNLLGIEEHIFFTAMKAENDDDRNDWMAIHEKARKMRSKLLKIMLEGHVEQESWCLTPDTLIFSNPNIKEISTFSDTDKILARSGKYEDLKYRYIRPYEGDMVKLTVNYSNIPLSITPNHKVFCADNVRTKQKDNWRKDFLDVEFKWKKAEDLTEKDFLLFPRLKGIENKKRMKIVHSWKRYVFGREHKIRKRSTISFPVNKDLMSLIGFYISEGCISKSKVFFKRENRYMKTSYVGWFFGKHEKKYADYVVKTVKKLFDANTTVHYRKSTIEIFCYKKAVVKFFEQFGHGALHKHIPMWVMKLPKKKLTYLIMALVKGDGNIDKYQIRYFTSSKTLAFQLRLILFKLGILHNISKEKNRVGKIDGREIFYTNEFRYVIIISGDAARKLSDIFPDYDGGIHTSGNFGYVLKDYIMIPIRKIEREKYSGFVYNLETPSHTYTTHTGIVSNCTAKHILGAAMRLHEAAYKYEGELRKELTEYANFVYDLFYVMQETVKKHEMKNKKMRK